MCWTQFWNFPLSFYHPEHIKINYAPQISSLPDWLFLINTEVFKGPRYEVNCNLQQDEFIVWANMILERTTLCLVHSTRCRQGLLMRETIPCSCNGTFLASGQVLVSVWTCPITFFSKFPAQRAYKKYFPKPLWHGCGMEGKASISSVFQLYLSKWNLVKDWWNKRSWGISLWAFIILNRKGKISSSDVFSTWLLDCLVKTEVFKRPSCEVNCNLQADGYTV